MFLTFFYADVVLVFVNGNELCKDGSGRIRGLPLSKAAPISPSAAWEIQEAVKAACVPGPGSSSARPVCLQPLSRAFRPSHIGIRCFPARRLDRSAACYSIINKILRVRFILRVVTWYDGPRLITVSDRPDSPVMVNVRRYLAGCLASLGEIGHCQFLQ